MLGVDINPLNWPGEILGGIGGDIAKLAVGAFDAIIKALFAPIAKVVTTQLIGWLVAVPNFTQGNVSQLERTVVAMGGGLLGAVATISIIRYWVAGFAGGSDSGFAALESLTRTVGAALFLAAWPWLFDTAVHLTNLFTSSLMGSGSVVNDTARLMAAGLGAGIALNFTPIGLFLNIAIAVAASLLFLGLLLLKIVVSVSSILIFIGMPLAAVLWPVMPWVARLAMRAFATCLAVPVLWALCFAASAAVSLNALSFNSRGFMNTLLAPLVAIVLLWVMLKLPIALARIAMLGGAALSGGFVSRAASYAASSQMRDTARQHLPSWAGGHTSQTDSRSSQGEFDLGALARERRRPDRHPPPRRDGSSVWTAVLRPARLGLPARAEDPQGRAQPAAKPVPVPHGRRPRRRGGHADRDGRLLDDDPRRPDSRARLRVTPEQALNFPNHHCLASWIAMGSRIPSFMGQTYPFPAHTQAWAEHHLKAMAERVAPYPDQLGSTLDRSAPTNGSDAHDAPAPGNGKAGRRRPRAEPVDEPADPATPTEPEPTSPAAKHEVRVDYEAPPEAPKLADSPVRRVVGHRVPGTWGDDSERPAPDSLRELVFLDRVNEIGPVEQLDGAANLPRLYDEDYAVLAMLDRAGLAPRSLIARAVFPKRAGTAVHDRLTKLHRHALIARHSTGLREHRRSDGKPPLLYSLTRRGLEVAQARTPTPAISPRRDWKPIDQARAARLAHDLHALGWAVELHHTVGTLATDHWRTPRYATGRYPVPQVGSGQRRHPITLNEIPVPDGQAIIDVALKTFHEVKPDLSLELRVDAIKLTFDLLVELDLTARASYNHDKFLAYDAFLCGWSLAHSRYQTQGSRPAVIFVCPDAHIALACANEADEALTGRIGVMGTPPEHWYYAGRDHLFLRSKPTSTTATYVLSHYLPSRLGYASDSPANANSSSPASSYCLNASFRPLATSRDESGATLISPAPRAAIRFARTCSPAVSATQGA